MQQKHAQLEAKIGEAGTSLAKKERQIRLILRDLLLSAADWLKEKEPADKVGK